MDSLQLPIDVSQWPDWAIPAIGAACAVLVLTFGYLIFLRKPRLPATPDPLPGLKLRRPAVQTMYSPTGQGGIRQRRTALRRKGNPIDVQIAADAKEAPSSAMVIDRSDRGLCLAVNYPHRVGAVVNVRPVAGDPSLTWVPVQVRNCRYVGKAYEVGCEFVKVPPRSVLILFG